ncbi:MBL fold metallo-hydrolase [Xylanimonas protaetiae]|uniref:MBL fold metallo-hydrolase n=1 Tax=Xylanimonas protaetiae TaxID=2509457 RepID=UPI0013EBEA2F|nr:MBL fold metallo-hydrolase [Xylanimonas protaetiae]
MNYVYDCGSVGSTARCKAEIRTYTSGDGAPSKVDMVFLSHFDQDHVNRVKDLVAAIPVERFVIPLVSAPERLLALARSLDSREPIDPDGWYASFVVNPRGALTALPNQAGDAEIIEIPPGTTPEFADDDVLAAGDVTEPTGAATTWVPPLVTRPARIEAATRGGRTRPVWLWETYVLADVTDRQRLFVQALAQELCVDAESLAKDIDRTACVRSLVMNESRALRKAYEAVSTDLNFTSLMLYSGPVNAIGTGNSAKSWRTRHGGVDRAEIAAWDVRPGWLGTGDAPLNSAGRLKEFGRVFERHLPNVGTFALPHHGSRWSLDPVLLDMFSPPLPACVVSATTPRYGHPHPETQTAVHDRGFHLVQVTGDPRSRWTSSATSWL